MILLRDKMFYGWDKVIWLKVAVVLFALIAIAVGGNQARASHAIETSTDCNSGHEHNGVDVDCGAYLYWSSTTFSGLSVTSSSENMDSLYAKNRGWETCITFPGGYRWDNSDEVSDDDYVDARGWASLTGGCFPGGSIASHGLHRTSGVSHVDSAEQINWCHPNEFPSSDDCTH